MKTNVKLVSPSPVTAEGAIAARITPEQELRRSVLSCLLFENSSIYEDGMSVAARIAALVPKVAPEKVAAIAVEARSQQHLRHVPLLLVREMVKHSSHKPFVAQTLATVIQRADELGESLSLYYSGKKCPIANQFKKGLAIAFKKFKSYDFGKYAGGAITPRDVMFLTHPVPDNDEQEKLWKKLADKTIAVPDTWEVALSNSKGEDKKGVWTRLLEEGKLGGFATLRNLRNLLDAKVDVDLIKASLRKMRTDRILPFRYIAAAKAAPALEDVIDEVMVKSLSQSPKLPGKTVAVIDVSGSMYSGKMSARSDMDRALAACSLAAILREVCESSAIYATAGNDHTRIHKTALVPSRHGMALVDAIYKMCQPLGGGGIFLNQVCRFIGERESDVDRMVVITDEQDCGIGSEDSPLKATPLGKHNYLINVLSDKNGIGYGPRWTHIDGWSESCVKFIQAIEKPLDIPDPVVVQKYVQPSKSHANKRVKKTKKVSKRKVRA